MILLILVGRKYVFGGYFLEEINLFGCAILYSFQPFQTLVVTPSYFDHEFGY